MNYYVGIDPGFKGAIAVIDSNRTVIDLFDAPILTFKKGKKLKNEYDLFRIRELLSNISKIGSTITFVEKMQSMPPGIRVQASFSLGYSQGVYEATLLGLGMAYQLVLPKSWQKHFEITKSKGDKKAQSYMIASKLFPTAELTGPKGGIKDGRSDALLIAEWGRIKNENL